MCASRGRGQGYPWTYSERRRDALQRGFPLAASLPSSMGVMIPSHGSRRGIRLAIRRYCGVQGTISAFTSMIAQAAAGPIPYCSFEIGYLAHAETNLKDYYADLRQLHSQMMKYRGLLLKPSSMLCIMERRKMATT